jgi:predicted secreted protein
MTTEAQIGYGAELWIANSSDVLTEIAEVMSVTVPNAETAEIEATHFKSPNRRREYIAGMIDDGEGTFEINYKPSSATSVLLQEAQNSGEVRGYKIVLPDGTGTWEVTGDLIVRKFERGIPIDNRMTATVTVRFTGASTEAAGA